MASGDMLVAFPPQSHQPPAGGGARFGVRNGHSFLGFVAGGSEAAYFTAKMSPAYAGGNIVAEITWFAVDVTGTGGWTVELERLASGGQDIDSDGFASAQTITSTTVPGTSGVIAVTSVTITAGSATDSIAQSDLFRVRVKRGTDTATSDINLLLLTLSEA